MVMFFLLLERDGERKRERADEVAVGEEAGDGNGEEAEGDDGVG